LNVVASSELVRCAEPRPKAANISSPGALNEQRDCAGSTARGRWNAQVERGDANVLQGRPTGTDWLMSTYGAVYKAPTNRTVLIDLTEPVSPTNPTPPISVAQVQAFLAAKCSDVNIDMSAIPFGGTLQCPGAFHFQGPRNNWYRLSFRPEIYPEVNDINVTCNQTDSQGCKLWTISPNGTYLTGTDPHPKASTSCFSTTHRPMP
jgi:hypothetical protein